MRILVVTNLYPGGVVPARGAFVANQVESLREIGHEVAVVAIDGARTKLEYLRGIGRVREALRRGPRDIVHAHYGLTALVAEMGVRLAPRERRAPVVATYLGSDVLWSRQRWLSRLAARFADLNIVMSEEMRRVLGAHRTLVLPNGTQLDRFHPLDPLEARRLLGWPSDCCIVLFPWDSSRPEKDFPLAEAAIAHLGATVPLRLQTFFGESQARYNLALNAADVVLLSSRWEGSPNAVREALAVGTPVVAVPVGDTSEMLGGLPLCAVVERTPGAIADGLRQVLEARLADPAAPPRKIESRHRVEPFGVRQVARRLTELYERLLADRTA